MKQFGKILIIGIIAILSIAVLTACDFVGTIEVTVSFDKDGGVGVAEDITVTYGENYGTLPDSITKDGYTFGGWFGGVGGTGSKITSTTKVTKRTAHTLYAKWAEDSGLMPLDKPTDLKIVDNILTWTEVPNAVGYYVVLEKENESNVQNAPTENQDNEGKYKTLNNEYSLEGLTIPEAYRAKVLAIGDDIEYADSELSDNIGDLIISGGNATFEGNFFIFELPEGHINKTMCANGVMYSENSADGVAYSKMFITGDYRYDYDFDNGVWVRQLLYDPSRDFQYKGFDDFLLYLTFYFDENYFSDRELDEFVKLSIAYENGIVTVSIDIIGVLSSEHIIKDIGTTFTPELPTSYIEMLDAPDGLSIDGILLSWNEVVNASGYMVWIDGAEFFTDTSELILSDLSTLITNIYEIRIKIKAFGDGVNHADSYFGDEKFFIQENILKAWILECQNMTVELEDGTVYMVSGGVFYSKSESGDYKQILQKDGDKYYIFRYQEDEWIREIFSQGSFTYARIQLYSGLADLLSSVHGLRYNQEGNYFVYSAWGRYFVIKDIGTTNIEIPADFTIALQKLDKPADLNIEGGILTWTAVDNASGYSIYVYGSWTSGSEYIVNTNEFSLENLTTGYSYIGVKAIGDGENYADSDRSNTIKYDTREQLATPSGLSVNGTFLSWNAVPNADYYDIEVDGVLLSSVSSSFVNFAGYIAYGTYSVRITAKSDGNYKDSERSEIFTYIYVEKAATLETEGDGSDLAALFEHANYLSQTLWNYILEIDMAGTFAEQWFGESDVYVDFELDYLTAGYIYLEFNGIPAEQVFITGNYLYSWSEAKGHWVRTPLASVEDYPYSLDFINDVLFELLYLTPGADTVSYQIWSNGDLYVSMVHNDVVGEFSITNIGTTKVTLPASWING